MGKRRIITVIFLILGFVIGCALICALAKGKSDGSDLTEHAPLLDNSEDTIYTPNPNDIQVDKETGITYVDNIIIVFFEDNVDEDTIKQSFELVGGKEVGRIPFLNQYQVEVPKCDYVELKNICDSLISMSFIKDAMPDLVIEISDSNIPNDPFGFALWNNWDEEKPSGNNWWLEAIEAPSAWDYNDCFGNIRIGVLDSGFELNHKDISNLISMSNSYEKIDHGTQVAGIISATPNNNEGISGVVWNCELICDTWKDVDGLGGWRTTTNGMMGKIKNMAVNGAKVINLSVGYSGEPSSEIIDEMGRLCSGWFCHYLESGLDFLVVQAAGNDLRDAGTNGLFASVNDENCSSSVRVSKEEILDRIIVVGAAQNKKNCEYSAWKSKNLGIGSNYGENVDIFAPGCDIYSTVSKNKYKKGTGTSLAAPIVTGVAALVWSVAPELSGCEVKDIVCNNTKYKVFCEADGSYYDLINAKLAVESAIAHKSDEADNRANKKEVGKTDKVEKVGKKEKEDTKREDKLREKFKSYVENTLIIQYGYVSTSESMIEEIDSCIYSFSDDLDGILDYYIRDFDCDGTTELATLRLKESDRNYNLLIEVYEYEKGEMVNNCTYTYPQVIKGEIVSLDVMVIDSGINCYFVISDDYESLFFAEGHIKTATILEYRDSEITDMFGKLSVGGMYSGFGDLCMAFSSICRRLGLNNSADCCDWVKEDGIVEHYMLRTDIDSSDKERHMQKVTLNYDVGLQNCHSKNDFYHNGVMVSFSNEEVLRKWYGAVGYTFCDLIVDEVKETFCMLWDEGEYHIMLDPSSLSLDGKEAEFSGTIVETNEPISILIVMCDGDYDVYAECIEINGRSAY